MIQDVYTPSVPQQDESVPPPPPPSGLPAARRRKGPANLLALVIGAVVGVLAAQGALPFDPDHGLLAVLGLFVALSLNNVLTSLLGPLSGLATVYSQVGAGRRLGATTVGGALVTFRLLPLILFSPCAVITDRPDLVRRLWWGTALQVLIVGAAGGALAALGGPAVAAMGWGFLLLVLLLLVLAPTRVTSTAWRLWRMPFRREAAKLDEWRCDPAVVAAVRAAGTARIDVARAALAAGPPSGSPRRLAVATMLTLAEGRHEEVARDAAAQYERSTAPSLRGGALYLYARAISDGVQAGRWPAAQALPHFATAIAALRAEAPALLARSDLAARDAYYRGDARGATRLARRAASLSPDLLTRAAALRALADAQHLAGAAPVPGPTHA